MALEVVEVLEHVRIVVQAVDQQHAERLDPGHVLCAGLHNLDERRKLGVLDGPLQPFPSETHALEAVVESANDLAARKPGDPVPDGGR